MKLYVHVFYIKHLENNQDMLNFFTQRNMAMVNYG